MLYRGGDCNQSDNRQFLKFTCVDTALGPPSDTDGSQAYVVVTDAKGKGITYHSDWVTVGENYFLTTPSDEERFEADQIIYVYSSNNTGSNTLLQQVQYHSSCSSNLELNNRFGASQLVEYTNPVQGLVSIYAASNFTFNITIPIDVDGDAATLESVTALANFGGPNFSPNFFDLSDQVAGQVLQPGSSVTINIPTNLDLTKRRRYTLLTNAVALANPSGQRCTGSDFLSFLAGNPAETAPTRPPTRPPNVSPAPTPNLQTAGCEIEARMACVTLDERNRVQYDCDKVPDPSTVVCTRRNGASGLGLQFLGGAGFPQTVWIEVDGGRTGTAFNRAVALNERFYAEGDFRGQADVTISNVGPNGPGSRLQTIAIDVSCEDDAATLRLGTRYGPLALYAFRNANGYQSSVYNARLTYAVANTGLIALNVTDATINSPFQGGPFNALTAPTRLQSDDRVIVFQEDELIDFTAKFTNNVRYTFNFNATGRATVSNLPCFNDVAYSF